MKIEIFPGGSGDCILVTSKDGKRLLADAGLPKAYDDFIASPLAALRKQNVAIDVAYVSHIDRDHIGGILRMLDHEVKWRVFEHMKKRKKKTFKEPRVPRPPAVNEIWHNAFLEEIGKTEDVELGAALTASANALVSLKAANLGDADMAARAAEVEMLALSVGDAIEVNWRIGKDQLDIPLNKAFKGKFMRARPQPIKLGSLKITVLGPTAKQLEKLRADWIAWLRKNKKERDRLRDQHKRDVEDLRSGLSPLDIARRSQDMALAIEKDVTPPNLASLVLLVEEDGKRLLLTGDAGDESLLEYFEAAGLLDANGRLEVDVLKVPHHGAHNSFSTKFVESVRAANYIFCGDGENHNPEPDVVEGYLGATKARPLKNGGITQFWFNWSGVRATDFKKLWKDVEGLFIPVSAKIKRRSLGKNDTRLTLQLP